MLILTTQCVTLALLVLAAAVHGVRIHEHIGGELVDHEPVDQEPVDQEPVDQEPVDHEPVDHEPVYQEMKDYEPVDHEPVDHEPVNHEPVDHEPVDDEPVDHEPVDHEPVDHEPVDHEPVDHEPVDDEPVNDEPVDHTIDDEHVKSNLSMDDTHSESISLFANDLYNQVTRVHISGNILLSPLVVQLSLIVAYLGAGGYTAKQLAQGTHLTESIDDVKTGFHQVLTEILQSPDFRGLEIASKIFLAITRPSVLFEYNRAVTEDFFSEIQSIDFKSRAASGQLINEWVDRKTHGKIHYIVSKSSFDPKTVAVLLSAAYFKGVWASNFDKNATYLADFHVNAKKKVKVKTMGAEVSCYFTKNKELGATIVQLPYKDETGSFVVILPFKVDGLRKVENKLHFVDLLAILDELKEKKKQIVKVHLPKFKLEQTLRLDSYLKYLGITEMFKPSANFSGISEESIYVNEVLTKAVLEVDEEGSPQVPDEEKPKVPQYPHFHADHPFVFLVLAQRNIVTFMGRYADPK